MYQALFGVPGDTEINNIGSLPLKGSECTSQERNINSNLIGQFVL